MKKLFKLAILGAVLLVSFGVGFAWRDLRSGSAPSPDAFKKLVGANGSTAKQSPTQVFRQAYSEILSKYYRSVDATDLKYAGMEGLMSSQGDPHTIFMEPKLAKAFADDTRGNFVGIGARLFPDPLGAKIVTVFREGPARRVGLQAGDLITAVDSKVLAGMSVEDIVDKIRGKEGTIVRLQIVRGNEAKPRQFAINRRKIVAPTAEGHVLEKTDIGYILVSGFSEPTAVQFEDALIELDTKRIKGLVIDLRNNPGGLLETAIDMLSLFAENKVVVKMKMRGDREEVAKTYSNRKMDLRYPVVLLIDEDSASAAEIFSGVLQDYRLATLVGDHTYGKASVQNVFMLVDGSSAKITIARYYLPRGTDIGRKVDDEGQYISGGLIPDIKVPMNLDSDVVIGDPKSDNQLQKAIEVIRTKQGQKSVIRPKPNKSAFAETSAVFGIERCA